MTAENARYHVKNWRAPRMAADPLIRALAERIAAEITARTPHGPTGDLSASWTVSKGRVTAAYLIANSDPAAKYVEYGTKNMAAEPMAGPVIAEYRAMVGRK